MSNYLHPNYTDQEMFDLVHEKIVTFQPFSLTRFGDGEIYFLNDEVPDALKEKVCTLLGKNISEFDDVAKNIKKLLLTSLGSTDALGLLDSNNPVCSQLKYSEKKWSITENFLKTTRRTLPIICDHQLSRNSLFGDINNFKKLLNGNSVTIISPNVEQLKSNSINERFGVAVHYVHSTNDRSKLLHDISSVDDFIVLYGTSLFAKDLGVFMKNQGKLCLDYGATLDAWAGMATRPWFTNGVQNHCFIPRVVQ